VKVHVQFYSRLRDLVGLSDAEVDVPDGTKVSDLLENLYGKTPNLREWNKSILVASGVEFVGRDHVLHDGEEISVMPPVQGG
jgi:molybdopterin converting factor small subunit